MKTTSIIGALTLLLAAAPAHAQSFIPGNQVDQFGPSTYANPTPARDQPLVATHASPIAANQIDDFGPLVPTGNVAEEELGAAGAEPGFDATASARAEEKAAQKAYAREQFLQSVWVPNP